MFDHFFIFSFFRFFYSRIPRNDADAVDNFMLDGCVYQIFMTAFFRYRTESDLRAHGKHFNGKIIHRQKESRSSVWKEKKKFMVLIFTGLTSPKPER